MRSPTLAAATGPAAPAVTRPRIPGTLEPWGLPGEPSPRSLLPAWGPVPLAVVLAAIAAIAYLIAAPPAADLAAANYRADLFARNGFALWDNGWYGGHALIGYSLLSPALGALLGVSVLLGLSTVVAAGLFATIAESALARPAAFVAAALFALSLSGEMLSGRVPYELGLALALGALLALQRGHLALALPAGFATSLASPIAGAFLALAGVALAISARTAAAEKRQAREGWPRGLWLAASALTPIALLALVFPEGGYEPFAPAAFWPQLAAVVLIAVALPRRWPALRIGAALYALALAGAFFVHTPVGGNAARLGALLAAPLVAAVLWGKRPLLLALLAPALVYWQLATPVSDLAKVAGDPSLNASYYAPLRAELARVTGGAPTRVEIPMTGAHSESGLIGGSGEPVAVRGLALARGWERQLDTRYGALFYRPHLSATAYRAWLEENAVAFVALPDVRLDESAHAEAALIRGGLPYLQAIWHSRHWRLYAVRDPGALATPPARLSALGGESFALTAPARGEYEVRVRFSPFWALYAGHGCVREAPGGWTVIDARSAGRTEVRMAFSAARIFDHGERCR
jgi:hypothetical protein